MEKLKNMWKDMSKKGKMLLGALVVILLIIAYNYIF
jgi:cell division protein FtsL